LSPEPGIANEHLRERKLGRVDRSVVEALIEMYPAAVLVRRVEDIQKPSPDAAARDGFVPQSGCGSRF
jgi:hypothetical protein